MTLSDEILRTSGQGPPPLRLPFDGSLSHEELRMAEQHTFDGPASWEETPHD
jgi:hypothetical protein